MADDLLTTNDAARALDVAPSTVKRWADAGVLVCERTPGGHRRFRSAELRRFKAGLRYMGEGAPVDEDSVSSDPLVATWVEQLAGADDTHGVLAALFEARGRSGSWWRVADELGPVLKEIGDRWALGRLPVAQEHRMSELLSRSISWTAQTLPIGSSAPRVLLVTAAGDDHLLGLYLAELCAREQGWLVEWLGRGTPDDEVGAIVRSGRVQMLAISASAASSDPEVLAAQLDRLAPVARQHRVALVLGGGGAWPDQPEYGMRARSFAEFKDLLQHLFRRT